MFFNNKFGWSTFLSPTRIIRLRHYQHCRSRHCFASLNMIDQSQYTIGVPAEPLEQYSFGGYHPVHLSDLLKNGQYEIIHKLGFGSFATVWLARDHHNQRNVSIKIVVASKSTKDNHELRILQCIRETNNSSHLGYKHVSQLLDWFYHDGPNGQHLCLVLEFLGPQTSAIAERCQDFRLDGNLARRISQQLLYAANYLHSCGIAHGDIHMGNVLFRWPDLEHISSPRVLEYLGTPEKGKISKKDGTSLEKGLPEYLVEPIEYERQKDNFFTEIQLVDFGESFFISSPPKLLNTPMSLHPPELVFQHDLTEAVDIWNLGSTTYELVTGRTPFEAFFHDHDLVPQFQKVVGGVPNQWIKDALNRGVLKKINGQISPREIASESLTDWSTDSSAAGFSPLGQLLREAYRDGYEDHTLQLGEAQLDLLERYLRKSLVVDPQQRATSEQLLGEEWISGAH